MSRVLKNATNQITGKYNYLTHKAVDVVKYQNKACEVIAHSDGEVVRIQTGKKNNPGSKGDESYGNFVKIRHNNGYYTLYAHLKEVYVTLGEKVKRGQVIGFMGNTGNAYGVHLHFEVRDEHDKNINPTKYLDSDLPNNEEKVEVIYQVYDNKKRMWLPNVYGTKDYAGNFGNPISGVYINLTEGSIKYRVHEKNNGWLPTVYNRDDYAGNLGKSIDGIQIASDDYKITYRVHINRLGWLAWVSKWDDDADGYAGIYGYDFDALQIKVEE